MIETIITHRTSDGKEFTDKDRAQAHQGALDMSDRIHAFVSAKYPENETAGKKAANIISEWEEWERLQDKGLTAPTAGLHASAAPADKP